MNNILIIVHGSNSHINAITKICNILKDRYKICIASTYMFSNKIISLGYQFEPLEVMPFASGFESLLNKKTVSPYINTLRLKKSDYFYLKRRACIFNILQKIQPIIILVDILYSSDVLLIKEFEKFKDRKQQILYIVTKICLSNNNSNPPCSYNFVSDKSFLVQILWIYYNTIKYFKSIANKIIYLGNDDLTILKNKINQTKINLRLKYLNFISHKFKDIPELILCPLEFEFKNFKPDKNQYYVGFQLGNKKNRNQINADSLNKIKFNKSKGKKIIYISFGTMYELYENKINSLVNKLLEIASREENWFFVFSFRNNYTKSIGLPKNCAFYNFVPQLDVLSNTDLFISHGGINSIKEALFFKVPTLIIPVNNNWDQPGNSARIFYHKLGQKAKSNSSVKKLKVKISDLVNNNEKYRLNIIKFNKNLKIYDNEYFLKTFDNILNTM